MKVNIVVEKIIKLLHIKQLKPVYFIGKTSHLWRILDFLLPLTVIEWILKRMFKMTPDYRKVHHEKS